MLLTAGGALATYFINIVVKWRDNSIKQRQSLKKGYLEERDDLTIRFIRGIIFRSREVESTTQNKPKPERRVHIFDKKTGQNKLKGMKQKQSLNKGGRRRMRKTERDKGRGKREKIEACSLVCEQF